MVKMNYAARSLLSFFSFNIGWWACALGASHGWPWLGPVVLPLFVGVHLYFSPGRKGEALFLAALGVIGFSIDTVLIRLGLFAITPPTHWAPAWLVAMWILLGQTYESMLMMRQNKYLLALSGAFSGPLSYYCFEALSLLRYVRPLWLSVAFHACFWAILTLGLFLVRDRILRLCGYVPILIVEPTVMAMPVAPESQPSEPRAAPSDPDKS